MSILDRICTQAAAAGIDPTAPIDAEGMSVILTKAENLGLLVYRPGMHEDWLDSLKLWAHEHHEAPWTFQAVAAAVLQLSVDAEQGFIRPRQLWTAVAAWQRRNLKQALAGSHGPEIPPELGGNVRAELAYRQAWTRAAAATGNRDQATTTARKTAGLPATAPQLQTTPAPAGITTRLAQLGNNLTKENAK